MMNISFLLIILAPLLSFAQTQKESHQILEKKKVQYLTLPSSAASGTYTYLEGDSRKSTFSAKNITTKPQCLLNKSEIAESLKSIPVGNLKYRYDGNILKFFLGQSDPWYSETPVFVCRNVNSKNPHNFLKKMYDSTEFIESEADGYREKLRISKLHPQDHTICITDDNRYVRLEMLIEAIQAFGSLDVRDKVFVDDKIAIIESLHPSHATVKFTDGNIRKVSLHSLLKINPAKQYAYQEIVKFSHIIPRKVSVQGTVKIYGEDKILIKDGDYKLVSSSYLSKL